MISLPSSGIFLLLKKYLFILKQTQGSLKECDFAGLNDRNIKFLKKPTANDTSLRKMPYFCTDYSSKTKKENEKNDNDGSDACERIERYHGPEACRNQV